MTRSKPLTTTVLAALCLTLGLLSACSATTGDEEDIDLTGASDANNNADGNNSDAAGDGNGDGGDGTGDGGDDVGENSDNGDDIGENSDGSDDIGENNDGSGDIGENNDADSDSSDDIGEHSNDADAEVDAGPRFMCELSLHSLTQRRNNRCLTFPEDFVLFPGQSVVIARDATPDEFRSCYPDFPLVEDTDWQGGGAFFENTSERVYYLDSSAAIWAIDDGLPRIDGDESYEIRDEVCRDGDGFRGSGHDTIGTGDLIEDRTINIPGSEFYNLDRRIPIRSAGSNSAWQIEEEGGRLSSDIPNPGVFPEFEHLDLVISEVSHADSDEACSFVEISCPFLDFAELPSCCYPDDHGDFCAPVRDQAHCHATGGRDFYPVGAVCNPVCSEIIDPIPECCVLFDEGPADDRCVQLNAVDCANAPGGGIPFARGQCALNLPCSEIEPPEPMCCIPGSPVGQCVSMDRVECESISGAFMPLGGCDPADCVAQGQGTGSTVTWSATAGSTYYVAVDRKIAGAANFTLYLHYTAGTCHIPFNETWNRTPFPRAWTAQANWQTSQDSPYGATHAKFTGSPTLSSFSRSLTSPVFDTSACPSTQLTVQWRALPAGAGAGVTMRIEVSSNGGSTWSEIFSYDTTDNEQPPTTEVIQSTVLANTAQARIRLRVAGDTSANLNKIQVDNVKVDVP